MLTMQPREKGAAGALCVQLLSTRVGTPPFILLYRWRTLEHALTGICSRPSHRQHTTLGLAFHDALCYIGPRMGMQSHTRAWEELWQASKGYLRAGACFDSRGGPLEGRASARRAAQRPRDHACRLAGVPAHILQGALSDSIHKVSCGCSCVICRSICWRSFALTEVRRRCRARHALRLQGDAGALKTLTSYRRACQTPARSGVLSWSAIHP